MTKYTITIKPVKATEPGALAGYEVSCPCGFILRTSLESLAREAVSEHWHWSRKNAAHHEDLLVAQRPGSHYHEPHYDPNFSDDRDYPREK